MHARALGPPAGVGRSRSSEARHDAVAEVEHVRRRHGGLGLGVVGVAVAVVVGALGKPPLDPRPRLGVGLPGRVPDGLLEPPVLPLLTVPHQPRLPALPHQRHRPHRRQVSPLRHHLHVHGRHLHTETDRVHGDTSVGAHGVTNTGACASRKVGAWLGSYAVALGSRRVWHVGLRLWPCEVELKAPAAAEGLWHHADLRRGALPD